MAHIPRDSAQQSDELIPLSALYVMGRGKSLGWEGGWAVFSVWLCLSTADLGQIPFTSLDLPGS